MIEEKMKRALSRIQKENNLNKVYCDDEAHPVNNGHHLYSISTGAVGIVIEFQNGPRNEPGSKSGVLDGDLLEIVRDRLKSFQGGKYASRENAIALTHIEEALMWIAKRANDRAEAGKLGTNKI
jgi:hypothetical protein